LLVLSWNVKRSFWRQGQEDLRDLLVVKEKLVEEGHGGTEDQEQASASPA
jgi:hypothetical protein